MTRVVIGGGVGVVGECAVVVGGVGGGVVVRVSVSMSSWSSRIRGNRSYRVVGVGAG